MRSDLQRRSRRLRLTLLRSLRRVSIIAIGGHFSEGYSQSNEDCSVLSKVTCLRQGAMDVVLLLQLGTLVV